MLTQFQRALFVFALLSCLGTRLVQAQAVNGVISGEVTDPTGSAVAGANVEIKNTATQVVRSVVTNAQGRYRVPELIVGTYDVRVSMQGFQTSVQTAIPVVVGGERVVDIALKIGQTQDTVTVEAQAAQVDTTSSSISTLVESKQIAELPLNGRNYTQLINLAPGIQQTVSGFPSGFYGRGNDYSVSGARPEGQAFLLDNNNVQDFWNHGPGSAVLGTTLGVDAIAEFSIQTNTYSAQFGGSGSAINAVTKSGTNAFHGSAFEFLRNSALDARAFYDGAKLPAFRRNQFGGSLGGPIKKDKAFFFFNYEGLRNDQGQTRIAFVPDAASRQNVSSPLIQQLLSYYPLPTIPLGGGIGEVPVVGTQVGNENYFIARVDYTLTTKDSVFTRYVSDRALFADPFSGSSVPLWPETHHTANQYATVEERHIFSPGILNLARVSFVRTKEGSDLDTNLPGLQFYPGRKNGTINITGLSPLGSSIFLPFYFVQNKFSEGDDVYWTAGNHNIRFGGDITRMQSNLNAPGWLGGQYVFNSLASFLQAKPFLFFGPLPNQSDGDRDFREIDVNGYIQDDWKVTPRLTLNMGLRYEFVSNPVTDKHPLSNIVNYRTDKAFTPVPHVFLNNPSLKNFDPRFGFAFDPSKDHKTSIRGGFGIFHNPISPRTYASGYYFNPPYSFVVTVFPTFPAPSFTAPLPSQSNAVNYDTPATPYQMQWNFNIQREIMNSTILTVGYVGSRGVHLFYQADQNPAIPTIGADGHQVFATAGPFGITTNPRINPALGPFNAAVPFGNSSYNSLQVNLNRRFQRNIQGQLSYTWSHCLDNSSNTYGLEGGFPIQNPYNASSDRGNCLFDRRHTLSLSSLVALPLHGKFTGHQLIEGWQLSGIATIHSGSPFSAEDGFDQAGVGTAFFGDRPNLKPGRTVDNITTGTLNQWFDPTAFVLPPVGELGNMGRNNLIGPGFWNLDFSVIKDTSITETFKLQFRAEFFNLPNHANWGLPNASVFQQTPPPGVAACPSTGCINPAAGTITTLASPMRQIQFGLKLLF